MKRTIALFIISLLLMGGAALAGPRLEFTLDAIENSSARDFGATYSDIVCQVTDRTGIDNTVIELQGSIAPAISNDLTWIGLGNSTVVNATSAATDNSSWYLQSLDTYVSGIRMHVLSGVGVNNTVTGQCVPGGR